MRREVFAFVWFVLGGGAVVLLRHVEEGKGGKGGIGDGGRGQYQTHPNHSIHVPASASLYASWPPSYMYISFHLTFAGYSCIHISRLAWFFASDEILTLMGSMVALLMGSGLMGGGWIDGQKTGGEVRRRGEMEAWVGKVWGNV